MNLTASQAMRRQRSPEETMIAYRAFLEEIRPIQKAIAKLLACMPLGRMTLIDGSLHVEPVHWPDGVRELYEECVGAAARRHGFDLGEVYLRG